MARPDTFWLTLTNIVLGILVVLSFLAIALETLCEALSNLRKRRAFDAELKHDMEEMFATGRGRAVLHEYPSGSVHKLLETVCRFWRRLSRR